LPQGQFEEAYTDQAYQPLTSAAIRQVARTFRKGTAQTDGWKLGHLAALSDAMLDLLGLFFVLAEQVGQYPCTARYVITTLIPKADGGLRPISLFSAVYRLHSRCCSGLLRHWAQTAGKHAMINMASGRHTNDGVYRLLMRRAVTHTTDEAASVLWDNEWPSRMCIATDSCSWLGDSDTPDCGCGFPSRATLGLAHWWSSTRPAAQSSHSSALAPGP
jgi:hypothetical protein